MNYLFLLHFRISNCLKKEMLEEIGRSSRVFDEWIQFGERGAFGIKYFLIILIYRRKVLVRGTFPRLLLHYA